MHSRVGLVRRSSSVEFKQVPALSLLPGRGLQRNMHRGMRSAAAAGRRLLSLISSRDTCAQVHQRLHRADVVGSDGGAVLHWPASWLKRYHAWFAGVMQSAQCEHLHACASRAR